FRRVLCRAGIAVPPARSPKSCSNSSQGNAMTTCDSLQQAQAIGARSRLPDSISLQLACGRTLHMGFFFDGFARNLEQDQQENRVSNIARLFLAHQDPEFDNEFHLYRAAYLSGLGADYDASLGARANGVARTMLDEMAGVTADVKLTP